MKFLETGTAAPGFSLPNQFGSMLSLEEFRDSQPVVLAFYPKDDTPG